MSDFATLLGLHVGIIPKELWATIVEYVSYAVAFKRASRGHCCMHQKTHNYQEDNKCHHLKTYRCKCPGCPIFGCRLSMRQVINFTNGTRPRGPRPRPRHGHARYRAYSQLFCEGCPPEYFAESVLNRVMVEEGGKRVRIGYHQISCPTAYQCWYWKEQSNKRMGIQNGNSSKYFGV